VLGARGRQRPGQLPPAYRWFPSASGDAVSWVARPPADNGRGRAHRRFFCDFFSYGLRGRFRTRSRATVRIALKNVAGITTVPIVCGNPPSLMLRISHFAVDFRHKAFSAMVRKICWDLPLERVLLGCVIARQPRDPAVFDGLSVARQTGQLRARSSTASCGLCNRQLSGPVFDGNRFCSQPAASGRLSDGVRVATRQLGVPCSNGLSGRSVLCFAGPQLWFR